MLSIVGVYVSRKQWFGDICLALSQGNEGSLPRYRVAKGPERLSLFVSVDICSLLRPIVRTADTGLGIYPRGYSILENGIAEVVRCRASWLLYSSPLPSRFVQEFMELPFRLMGLIVSPLAFAKARCSLADDSGIPFCTW